MTFQAVGTGSSCTCTSRPADLSLAAIALNESHTEVVCWLPQSGCPVSHVSVPQRAPHMLSMCFIKGHVLPLVTLFSPHVSNIRRTCGSLRTRGFQIREFRQINARRKKLARKDPWG